MHVSALDISTACYGERHVRAVPGAPNSAKFRGGCRFGKGGVTKKFEFLRDKNINFLEVLR